MIEASLCGRLANVQNQIFATIVANACCLGHGLSIGWTSSSLPLLGSYESPLASGPVSANMAAWIGAVSPLGGLCGTLFFGLLSNHIGSKRAMLLSALPITIHWMLMLVAEQAWVLIAARFLSGLTGGGVFICFPLFVAEIANERIRGRLSSTSMLSFNSGIVLAYATCSYLDFHTVPLILIVPPIVFISVFVWLPNTPQFLLKSGNRKQAEKSLRYYRNILSTASSHREQLLCAELDKFVQIAKQNAEMPPVRFADFFTGEAIRSMLIVPTLMASAQFSGTFTLQSYANTIFRASGSDLDPNTATMIMGSIQVLGSICVSTLVDRLGRKVLLLISTAGAALVLLVTGTFTYLNTLGYDMTAINSMPVVSLSIYTFITAVGITPVPFVLVSEVLPPNIRRIGATICVCSAHVFAFVMLLFFPRMLDALEMHGCMWLFACVSTAGFVFTLLVVRETKGMNLDQLQSEA